MVDGTVAPEKTSFDNEWSRCPTPNFHPTFRSVSDGAKARKLGKYPSKRRIFEKSVVRLKNPETGSRIPFRELANGLSKNFEKNLGGTTGRDKANC